MPRAPGAREPDAAASPNIPIIKITATGEDREVWKTVFDVADALGDRDDWCLVGGLMVQLFAMEDGQTTRPTEDIDLLADPDARPSATGRVADVVRALGAHVLPHGLEHEKGFRWEMPNSKVVDILAPQKRNYRKPPTTTGKLLAFQIPGGSHALDNKEQVQLELERRVAKIWRPTRLAAVLLKMRALAVHDDKEAQREDLVTLLAGFAGVRQTKAGLTKKEVAQLRAGAARLNLDDPRLADTVGDPTRLRAARGVLLGLTRLGP